MKTIDLACKVCKKLFIAKRKTGKFCFECSVGKKRIYTKAYQKLQHSRELRAIALRKKREIAINAYGGKCACCGESQYEFLAIDHVHGGGQKERKILSTQQIVNKVIKLNFPPEYQLLCHNCNSAKGFYGYCPHKRVG